MTEDGFRRIALGMDGAVEGAHMGHPDFRAGNGRIFASLHPDGRHGVVKLPLDRQAELVRADPATFEPASGAWGRQGFTMILLRSADEETVGEALTIAWKDVSAKSGAGRPRGKRSDASTPRAQARKGRSPRKR